MTPEQVGKLTLPQLECMASEKPPSRGKKIRSYAEYEAAVLAEEAAWSSDAP